MYGRCALLLLVVCLACSSDGPAGPETGAPDNSVLLAALGGASAVAGDGTNPCPDGGTVTNEAGIDVTHAGDETSITWHLVMQFDACGVTIENGLVLTDGTMTVDGFDRYRQVDGQAPTLLESSAHQTGRLRIRHGDYDRTCDIDVSRTFDPATRMLRFTGTVCDDPVSFTFERPDL